MFFLILGFLVGLVIGYTLVTRRPKESYFAVAEYWVFLPGEQMPTQDAVMTRMIAQNPYAVRGQSPVGTAEGLIFSDIRLHIALVLRSRNPHVFRPDIFDAHVDVSPETLAALSEANAFVKLRYLSEQPLKDRRHLQFLLHAADAYAALAEGTVIYDVVAQQLMTPAELSARLKENFDATGVDLHARTVWTPEIEGATAETRGLKKIGFPEVRAAELEGDVRVLVSEIMAAALAQIWSLPEFPSSVEVAAYDDRFRLLMQPPKDRVADARILRIQTA